MRIPVGHSAVIKSFSSQITPNFTTLWSSKRQGNLRCRSLRLFEDRLSMLISEVVLSCECFEDACKSPDAEGGQFSSNWVHLSNVYMRHASPKCKHIHDNSYQICFILVQESLTNAIVFAYRHSFSYWPDLRQVTAFGYVHAPSSDRKSIGYEIGISDDVETENVLIAILTHR